MTTQTLGTSQSAARNAARVVSPANGAERPRDDADAPSAADATRLLTADDLAARWSVPKAHVYRLTRRGEIPTVKLGRYVRYRTESIQAWERDQEAGSNAQ